MANFRHLNILKHGAKAWNHWRLQHPKTIPDLIAADLKAADLCEANFSGANLGGAEMAGSDLHRADLSGASLRMAKLRQANLEGASLSGANLWSANLEGANLNSADLGDADLREAVLRNAQLCVAHLQSANLLGAALAGADFYKASLGWTIFGLTSLAEVLNLDEAEHFGPSSVGIETIFASNGKIPEEFLRGAGVPEIFIEYAASLAGKPIEFYSAFISYSSKDDAFAKRLYADLQAAKVRCWFAPEDLKIGDKFRPRIDDAIRFHDKLLLILSEHSVASDWVEKEVETAFEKERKEKRTILFPIRLDDAVMQIESGWPADIRRTRHIGDLSNWKNHDSYQTAFNRLLRDLKSKR